MRLNRKGQAEGCLLNQGQWTGEEMQAAGTVISGTSLCDKWPCFFVLSCEAASCTFITGTGLSSPATMPCSTVFYRVLRRTWLQGFRIGIVAEICRLAWAGCSGIISAKQSVIRPFSDSMRSGGVRRALGSGRAWTRKSIGVDTKRSCGARRFFHAGGLPWNLHPWSSTSSDLI